MTYKPAGEFRSLSESKRQRAFVRADPDSYITNQANQLAEYLPNFGVVSAKEVLLMLSAWLAKPENAAAAEQYLLQLKGKET